LDDVSAEASGWRAIYQLVETNGNEDLWCDWKMPFMAGRNRQTSGFSQI